MTPQQGSPAQNISPGEPGRRGPASVGTEATIEAKVKNQQTEPTSGTVSKPQIEFRYSPESSSQSKKGALRMENQNPAGVLAISGDSSGYDSAKARADSTKKHLQNPEK